MSKTDVRLVGPGSRSEEIVTVGTVASRGSVLKLACPTKDRLPASSVTVTATL